jgi:hypothetical protein
MDEQLKLKINELSNHLIQQLRLLIEKIANERDLVSILKF